jgi:hypothetical protein
VSSTLLPLYTGGNSRTQRTRGWVGPTAGLDALNNKNNFFLPCRETRSSSSAVQPVTIPTELSQRYANTTALQIILENSATATWWKGGGRIPHETLCPTTFRTELFTNIILIVRTSLFFSSFPPKKKQWGGGEMPGMLSPPVLSSNFRKLQELKYLEIPKVFPEHNRTSDRPCTTCCLCDPVLVWPRAGRDTSSTEANSSHTNHQMSGCTNSLRETWLTFASASRGPICSLSSGRT